MAIDVFRKGKPAGDFPSSKELAALARCEGLVVYGTVRRGLAAAVDLARIGEENHLVTQRKMERFHNTKG